MCRMQICLSRAAPVLLAAGKRCKWGVVLLCNSFAHMPFRMVWQSTSGSEPGAMPLQVVAAEAVMLKL